MCLLLAQSPPSFLLCFLFSVQLKLRLFVDFWPCWYYISSLFIVCLCLLRKDYFTQFFPVLIESQITLFMDTERLSKPYNCFWTICPFAQYNQLWTWLSLKQEYLSPPISHLFWSWGEVSRPTFIIPFQMHSMLSMFYIWLLSLLSLRNIYGRTLGAILRFESMQDF